MGIVYRLFVNNQPAEQNLLNRIESITVDQAMDKAWEAQFQVPLCVDRQGQWSGEDEEFAQGFSRLRVEIKIRDDQEFVPLIDGPVVGVTSNMVYSPGQSQMTVIVHDDSTWLARESRVRRFENKTDDQVARLLFADVPEIGEKDTDPVPPPREQPYAVVQRGTAMNLLRELASRNHMHAYVLPGDRPGQSRAFFKRLPATHDGLADMVLMGADRNVLSFGPRINSLGPSRSRGSSLSLADRSIENQQSRLSDLQLMGDEPLVDEGDAAEDLLLPGRGESMDLRHALEMQMDRSAMNLEAEGRVLCPGYPDVLRPYRVVNVRGANGRLSGPYTLTKVVHRLTRSDYTQTFTGVRNAVSGGSQSHANPGSGGLSANTSINVSGSIF